MSLPFFDGADHLAPMSVVGGVFEAFPHTNSQKAENQSWDHISRSTTSLKPEDLASLDGDRYSQSSSDEYFSQTSDSTSHTSPLSDSWSEHNSRRQHAVAASQTTKSDDLQRPTSSTNSPGNTRSHSVQDVNIEQDVTIRLKSQQHSAAADQSFGGLTIDTSRIANDAQPSRIANDAQPSRMRPEPRIPLEERSSRRRNFAGPLGGSAPPPKLKRDTEQTDAIVKMIVLFCTNLISSIWTPGTVQPGSSQSRTGSNVLPLQVFITETLRRSKTSYSTLQIALYYLILLKQALPSSGLARQASQGCRALQCGRRMFLTALILASKYLQDRNYTARAWSKISGLPLKEINENERRYLSIVCWNLHVPKATFENWSKIVLSVCRLSIDAEAHGREQDVACAFPSSPPSPGSGPSGQTCGLKIACEATLSALQTWWAINLKSLCTDIVNCPRKTEQYVGAITPFRTTPLLPRPVRDESWSWKSAPSDTLAQSNGRCVTRLPSLESMTKSFFNQDAHDSPAVSSKPVPRRMLANLPTPQQTPYAHEMWTPQLTRPGIRSRPSASALASIDQRRCPLAANLDTCPPPMPRPQTFQSSQAWTAWRQSIQSTLPDRSTTSSPESVISDASSVFSVPGFARSRSSSISSSMSWMAPENAGQAPSDENNDKPTLCRRILEDSHLLALQQPATRLNALSLNPVRNDVIFDETPKGQTHCWTEGPNLNAQEPAVLQEQKSSESSFIRNYHQLSTSSQSTPTEPLHQAKVASYLPKSCRPRLDKSKTASFELGEAAPMHLRSLKRSRTTSVDITSVPQTWSSSFNMASSPADLGFRGTTLSAEELEKEIVNPSCGDKKPRKPISCGTGHNKRTALSVPSPAGTNYARQVLHQDWYSTITPQDIQIQG